MSNFFKGLVIAILGLFLWIIASVFVGIGEAVGSEPPYMRVLMYIGFFLIFIGPIIYWMAIPIRNRLKRKKRK